MERSNGGNDPPQDDGMDDLTKRLGETSLQFEPFVLTTFSIKNNSPEIMVARTSVIYSLKTSYLRDPSGESLKRIYSSVASIINAANNRECNRTHDFKAPATKRQRDAVRESFFRTINSRWGLKMMVKNRESECNILFVVQLSSTYQSRNNGIHYLLLWCRLTFLSLLISTKQTLPFFLPT